MKKKLFIVGGVLLAVIVMMALGVTDGLSEGASVPLGGIRLEGVPDGSYTGSYDFKRWSNSVVVRVENHAITSVEIAEGSPSLFPPDVADEIFARVIAAQDTDVDAVSGATVTSKAYLKAIENAVEGAAE